VERKKYCKFLENCKNLEADGCEEDKQWNCLWFIYQINRLALDEIGIIMGLDTKTDYSSLMTLSRIKTV